MKDTVETIRLSGQLNICTHMKKAWRILVIATLERMRSEFTAHKQLQTKDARKHPYV